MNFFGDIMVEVVSFSSLEKFIKKALYLLFLYVAKGGESIEKTMGVTFSLLHTHVSRVWERRNASTSI